MKKEILKIAKELIKVSEKLLKLNVEEVVWLDEYYDGYFVPVQDIFTRAFYSLMENLPGREIWINLIKQFKDKLAISSETEAALKGIILLENGEVFETIPNEEELLKKRGKIEISPEVWELFYEEDIIASRIVIYYTNKPEIFAFEI